MSQPGLHNNKRNTQMAGLTNEFNQPISFDVTGWVPPKRPQNVVLEGDDVRIVPLDVTRDAAQLFQVFCAAENDANWTYLPYGPFRTEASFTDWLDTACRGDDPKFYTIQDRNTNHALGIASYLRIDPNNGVIEIGHIHLSSALQQTRSATEAMVLMMRYAFDLGYRRYEWKCDALNLPSRAAAQRLGLSYNGVFPQAVIYKNRNRDTAWYAVVADDWPALNTAFTQWLDPANFGSDGRQIKGLSQLTKSVLRNLI
jgi:RimJ/RimL family protein N-acetyltransferase